MSRYATEDGYELFFNRDERRTRQPARSPSMQVRESVRFAAPIDADGGGSWIAVNEFGLTACLLNGFADAQQSEVPLAVTTRGTLPLAMMPCRSAAVAREQLQALEPARFSPFVLVVTGFREPGWCARWNGRDISLADRVESPLISSSFFTEEVRKSRESVFEALAHEFPDNAIDRHLSFHRSHRPRRGAHSPCMHREDAGTVSLTRVTVTADACRLSYLGDSPCRDKGQAQSLEMARREAGALIDDAQ